MGGGYDDQVFINCPYDEEYRPLFQALLFAIHDCGMTARSALEVENGAEVRIEKIGRIIGECAHSIHDLSRVETDGRTGLPRMNMPFELGLFLGARRYGGVQHRRKTCLILDREPYRYRLFLSDISGQDIRAHHDDPAQLIRAVRNGLATTRPAAVVLHSGSMMARRYDAFLREMPALCRRLALDADDLGHRDLALVISVWVQTNAGSLRRPL